MTAPPIPDHEPRSAELAALVKTFQGWLHLPDPAPLYAVLAAVIANRMQGDPLWLLLIGSPGRGKTELLQAIRNLPSIHRVATLTEPALLSGTPAKEKAKGAKGGLLREVGPFGILLLKDFGSVLSMHREARAQVLAALREIYDGEWTRRVGTDGARELRWEGKLGLVGGCTPTIDSHHAVMATMGERFVMLRLSAGDEAALATAALDHGGRERVMREELAAAVAGLFATVQAPDAAERLDDAERDRMVALACLITRCRSAVERDGYSREITLIPDPEAPGRLALTLWRLLAALDVLGVERAEGWRVVARVALDSMPALRRAALERLISAGRSLTTAEIAVAARHPTKTMHRALEDLDAHRVVIRNSQGRGKANLWTVSDQARAWWAATGTEVSGGVSEPPSALSLKLQNIEEDFSVSPPDEPPPLADDDAPELFELDAYGTREHWR